MYIALRGLLTIIWVGNDIGSPLTLFHHMTGKRYLASVLDQTGVQRVLVKEMQRQGLSLPYNFIKAAAFCCQRRK